MIANRTNASKNNFDVYITERYGMIFFDDQKGNSKQSLFTILNFTLNFNEIRGEKSKIRMVQWSKLRSKLHKNKSFLLNCNSQSFIFMKFKK